MNPKITVAIPVGPEAHHQEWFRECLESVRLQTYAADEILIISDMAKLDSDLMEEFDVTVWKSPWRLGIAAAMNFGVALAKNELVFMLCADDTLNSQCLAFCARTYGKMPEETRGNAYYFVGVKYLDGREEDEQFIPCGAAMVTKSLWKQCGGFPPESSSGAPDAALISIMMVHQAAGECIGVGRGRSLYNYRPHANSDSAKRQPWQGVILNTRDIVTRNWKPPEWGRYEV